MDTQSVAPSGSELSKKSFTLATANGSLAAQCKRGAITGPLEGRPPTVSCSFTFGGRNRRSSGAHHQLSRFSQQQGCGSTDDAAEDQSWLVSSHTLMHHLGARRCSDRAHHPFAGAESAEADKALVEACLWCEQVGSRGPAHASFLWPFSFGKGKHHPRCSAHLLLAADSFALL